jgi:hypothetical protein
MPLNTTGSARSDSGPRLGTIDSLNRACFCVSLDQDALARALDLELGLPGLSEMVRQRCPFMFAAQPVFLAAPQLLRMAQVVQAVESVVALPAYRDQVLAGSPAIARQAASGPRGVFFGYDFHVNQDSLGLIEINTNSGGAMLNAVLARAQRASCAATETMVPTLAMVAAFEREIVDMFHHEWSLAGRTEPLASIAIVDEAPEQQYLYPEFLLFQQLFERHGLRTVIADPAAFEWREGKLWHGDLVIDLVYNRLTDFYLEHPANTALREAYVQQEIVLTPHPQAHALYADKRRLALFSDAARLQALGVPEAIQQVLLEHVPHTEVVTAADGERLWTARRGLFFKPVAGYGSRAAYRGDKLTRRVWQEILAGDYVAQAIVAPGERMVNEQDVVKAMKFDLRAYAYDGAVQWVAARLYQGQTTNFRTPGGGFAPVYSSADVSGRTRMCCSDDGIVDHAADSNSSAAEAGHASYVFLLDADSGIHAVPHGLYVALARGLAAAPALAGQTLRLADWFVQLKDGAPDSVVNESYSELRFSADGYVDRATMQVARPGHPDAATVHGDVGWPTAEEYERMRVLLFGGTESSATPSSILQTARIISTNSDMPPTDRGRQCR